MNPRRSNSTLPRPGRSGYGVASAVVLLLIPVVVLVGGDAFQQFLNFGAGVLSLVALSCSVIWGLVAQDRIFLNTRQRIVGQAVHRTTAVASIAFLLLHITTKIALDHTQLIVAIIPFSLGFTGNAGLIGLGSVAALLMIFVGITGALRSNFATPAPVAAHWRAMHMLAYPAWCAALVHGLYAGRSAKPIFVILYSLSLVGVMGALALRAAPRPVKRRIADQLMTILGGGEPPEPADLDASRARVAEPSLPGYENLRAAQAPRAGTTGSMPRVPSPTSPLYGVPAPAAGPAEPTAGLAATYQAVSTPRRAQQPFAADQTARMNLPLNMQATEAIARVEGTGSTSGGWPLPSPPPVGEAHPSAYDPLNDTGHNIPSHNSSGMNGYGGREVYDTGETTPLYGTYNSNDTYPSGPATEPPPGASFDAPGSGEPWNTPSGGCR